MPKRPCTQRAEWRLTPGKPAERLSGHYQLDCDYGTALITIYKESDSIEPIYLCENHAKEVGGAAKRALGGAPGAQATETKRQAKEGNRAKGKDRPKDRANVEVRARNESQAQSENRAQSESQIESESQTKIEARAKIETETKGEQTRGEERSKPVEVGGAKPNGSVPPEVKSSRMPATSGASTKDPVRAPARDLAYGSSAKALVDEAIWNLASGDYETYRAALRQGKTTVEAAQAAGGQLAIIHRKIGECTLTIETLLLESKARINAAEVLHKPLEQAMLDIIGSSAIGEAEKDAAIEELETLQESFSRGLHQEITPLEAHRIACAIGERAKWGASAGLSEELKPAYRALYSNVRNVIAATVPDAVNIVERLANLYAAKADIENAPQPKLSHHADSVSITS